MIRIAAVGDVHFGEDSGGSLRPHFHDLSEHAEALLLAGDLTRRGDPAEAKVLASELAGLEVPVVAVLGNHDHHRDRAEEVTGILEEVGITIVEGEGVVLELNGGRLGVAGVKGFGGGFPGTMGAEFGEPLMRAFMSHSREEAAALLSALASLPPVEMRVALTHYSPIRDTLAGEPPEIYPFLGCSFLAEAIDKGGADLAIHGHAHLGSAAGTTPGGVPVRNVAQPVLKSPYVVFEHALT